MQPEEFAKQMASLWSKPRDTADANLAMRQYMDALARFTPAQLDAGWDRLRDTHDRTSWPLIYEVRKAILSAPNESAPRQLVSKWDEHRDFANASMQSPLAVRARDEGWLLGLWDFCNDHGRLPQAHEIGRIRDVSDRANAAAATLDSTDRLQHAVLAIWYAMRAREQKLCALVPPC